MLKSRRLSLAYLLLTRSIVQKASSHFKKTLAMDEEKSVYRAIVPATIPFDRNATAALSRCPLF